MSYFIANSISFSKDFKTFKVKGGDNNCFPRSNSWLNDIAIEHLYDEINGGNIQFRVKTNEKIAFINRLVDVSKFENYWSLKRKNPNDEKIIAFDKKFIEELKNGLKSLSNKKEYILFIASRNSFIFRRNKRSSYTTGKKEMAQKFSYNVALGITKEYKDLQVIKIDW